MATIQKQQALTVLIDLLNRRVTESQIVQLINFAGEWNKYLQQPVGISNNQSMLATIRVVAVVMAMAVTFQ